MIRTVITGIVIVWSISMGASEPKTPQPGIPAGSIIIQGEDFVTTDFVADELKPPHTTLKNQKIMPLFFPQMSHGKASMLCTRTSPAQPFSAVYNVQCVKAGRYVLWVYEQGRAWSSPFRWQVDSMGWNEASVNCKMLQMKKMGNDGPIFSWVRLGAVELPKAGRYTLRIEVTAPRPDNVYLLSQDQFVFLPAPHQTREPWPMEGGFERPGIGAVYLWKDVPPGSSIDDGYPPWMDTFLLKTDTPKGAVLVCPGGAYLGLANTEGDTIARKFNSMGYHAFVLHYRVKPHQYPSQILDVARAVRIIRHNAQSYGVNPDRIALCGFSAGGHLSASLGVHFERVPPSDDPVLDSVRARPDALILCYPGLSMFGTYDKNAWQMNIMPDTASMETKKTLSVELYVTKQTPPTFLWHCFDDQVDVRNSLVFATALRENNVPCEMHIYPKGGHGLNLAEGDTHVGTWTMLCNQWLTSMGW